MSANLATHKIEKEIITDPDLDVLSVRTRFSTQNTAELFLYVLLPHIWAMAVRTTTPGSTHSGATLLPWPRMGTTRSRSPVRFRF